MAKCTFCGKEHDGASVLNTDQVERGLCFTCAFWFEKVAVKDDPLVARVDGTHYWIEENDTTFKGFGGHDFTIKFDDGREVASSNLWCQGHIPPQFKELLPNNAQFLR